MKIPGGQKTRHFIAKRGWAFILVFFLRLTFFIILDRRSKIHLFAITFIAILIWATLIEPHTIQVKKRYFDIHCKAKIALISDLHLGIHKKQQFLERIIKKINRLHVDYIFIAGDLTYYPKTKNLEKLFAPLALSQVPVYVVLGNHDVERPGRPVRPELISALEKANAHFLNNTIVHLAGFTLVGLGEYRSKEDNVDLLRTVHTLLPIIVLTHNPSTIKKYTNHPADLTLCGHTHGWQITLPFLEKLVGLFSSKLKHISSGYLKYKDYNYFITGGVGEVGLPIRFFSPPTIDILYLGQKRRTLSRKIKDQITSYKSTLSDILSTKKTEK